MNVLDSLKKLSIPEIAEYCTKNSISASVAMCNIGGDFNFSTMVRNANFFGFRNVHHIGKKRWDKRGSVGTYKYTPIYFYEDEESFLHNQQNSTLIAIENNIPKYTNKTHNLLDYNFINCIDPIFIFGEENRGLSDNILDFCKIILTIPHYGSVRSLNVGTTSGIVMAYYRSFIDRKK